MEQLDEEEKKFLEDVGIKEVENLKTNENQIVDFIMSKSRKEIPNNLSIYNNILKKVGR